MKKEGKSKQGQTNNKVKQHSTPKAVTFPKKNELPRVGLEPTTLYTLDRALHVHPNNTCDDSMYIVCTLYVPPGSSGTICCAELVYKSI